MCVVELHTTISSIYVLHDAYIGCAAAKGAFTYYVINFWPILDSPLPPP